MGELCILNVGDGDTKITFDPDRPDDIARAAATVKDMIRRGFAILIQVGESDGDPIYKRAHDFDEKTVEYIIAGIPQTEETANVQESPISPQGRRPAKAPARPKRTESRILASGTRAIAVARTAGG